MASLFLGRINFEDYNGLFCSLINLGPLNDILVIMIALLQAAIIAAMYLGLAFEKPFYSAACLTGLFFLFIIFAFTLSDTVFRGTADEIEAQRIQITVE
jgi:hypothetical protein